MLASCGCTVARVDVAIPSLLVTLPCTGQLLGVAWQPLHLHPSLNSHCAIVLSEYDSWLGSVNLNCR